MKAKLVKESLDDSIINNNNFLKENYSAYDDMENYQNDYDDKEQEEIDDMRIGYNAISKFLEKPLTDIISYGNIEDIEVKTPLLRKIENIIDNGTLDRVSICIWKSSYWETGQGATEIYGLMIGNKKICVWSDAGGGNQVFI